jgi:hypothetical protein
MRIVRIVLLAGALLALGCASNNKGKIEGHWSSQATSVKGQTVPAGALQLTFGSDHSLTYKAGPQTFTGAYNLGMGDYVTLNLNQELGGRKTHVERISVEGNQLTMTDSDGTEVVFDKTN